MTPGRKVQMRQLMTFCQNLTITVSHALAIDICKAADQTTVQLQAMQNGAHDTVNYVQKRPTRNVRNPTTSRQYQKVNQSKNVTIANPECKYCGRQHAKRECPVYG